MPSERIIDAFCTACDDISPHEVLDTDPGTARCTVCEHEQQVMVA